MSFQEQLRNSWQNSASPISENKMKAHSPTNLSTERKVWSQFQLIKDNSLNPQKAATEKNICI